MDGDKNKTVQKSNNSKDREIVPMSKKPKKKKCAQKKELIDAWGESSINTVAEEFVSSENIAS